MAKLAGFVVLLLLCVPAAAGQNSLHGSARVASPSTGANDLLFDKLARRWLERQEYDSAEALGVGLEEVLKRRLTRLEWGALDLRMPPEALADPRWCRRITGSLDALLEAQTEFLRWLAGPASAASTREIARDTKAHVKELKKWLKGLKPRHFADLQALRGKDLIDVLQPKPSVVEALRAFNAYLVRGGPLQRKVELRRARIIFQPTRRDLVEFACTVGLLRPKLREFFWVSGLENWTVFDFDGTRVVGMQYAGPKAEDDYTDAIAMDGRNKNALFEHVVQLGVRSLMESVSRGKIEPLLAGGLANELVIELYGEVDTRSDGDLRSRSTLARSVFVPGANSSGGFLPPASADSRWRSDKGKHHFQRVLKRAQKGGGKRARSRTDKLSSFRLITDDESDKFVIQAPFLGPQALAPPPAKFFGDYAELLRAYRAGFLYWLRTEAGGKRGESGKLFSELLRASTDPRERRDLAQLFEETYGTALSAGGPGELFESDSLEGRFLVWLSK